VPALLALLTLLLTVPTAVVEAQPAAPNEGEQKEAPLVLHAYKLGHQPAIEALPLVYSLLSPRGTLEIKPAENTLVLRDERRYIDRVVRVLERFDHPGNPMRLSVQIIQARSVKFSPGVPSELPAALETRLHELMPNHTFRRIAATDLHTREGEGVSYQLGANFQVRFKVGTVADGERLRLHGFQVLRRAASGPVNKLIHTTLNLRLEQTLYLGLAPSEDSREVLMLVISARRE
jgi:hypothetical protein